MIGWLAEFRSVKAPAKIAETHSGPNLSNHGTGTLDSDASAYVADAHRLAGIAFADSWFISTVRAFSSVHILLFARTRVCGLWATA
jgi:hypothetical protein